ncbi:oligosaccharide flippase family protein [Dyadobacter sp. CY345]|uniref:lipopolysaccharide biosynthesis protein n=1 Tax=Dyadobacter sp. CY345 TaxID=2909335 RepID=UPI001F320286|nr:oligosaccharide flippase family protein [Dyadobacter sp. CY345]MCF2447074.1 oligosaccharide flippase family protein [Dyadobacter sp. CY345]
MTNVLHFISNNFTKGHERSIKAKKNIGLSFLIKGASIAISLILVPLTINYINPYRYGIWLTLSSVVSWFSFFDIGLTNGLRNKLVQAKSEGNIKLAKIYISTTYSILALIFAGVWVLLMITNQFLNWSEILKISPSMESEISFLAIIIFSYFCLQFVLRVITTLIIADQQPAKTSLLDLLGQILSLILIFILVKTSDGSLVKLGIALCVSPLIVLVGANLYYFNGVFKKYRPSFADVKFAYSNDLLKLGFSFFVIQIAAIIQYESANIIISRNFGAAEVTSYNVVYKYFGILHMVFMIFITPFWSASTEAFFKNDIAWIRNGIRKYNMLNIAMFFGGLLMLLFSDMAYSLWLGKGKVDIDFSLSLYGFIFFSVGMFGSKYVNFLNGINALRLQFWSSVISPFLYVGTVLVLIRYFHIGVYAVFIGAIIANINAYLIAPLQYYMIIVKGKKGIWIR